MTAAEGGPRPAHQAGYLHDLLLYRTDDELLDVAVPFVRDGVGAGEPVLVRDGTAVTELLRGALGPGAGVTFFDGAHPHPAMSVARMMTMVRHLIDIGAPAVRVVGQVPHLRADGAGWDQWATYEAVANDAFAELPMWSLCAYDRRATSPAVLAEATRTHPAFAPIGSVGREAIDTYVGPIAYLDGMRQPDADPLEATGPDVELTDVRAPHPVRVAVTGAGEGLLAPDALADLGIAVSEVTANAILYGLPPVTVRLWRRPDRLLVTIADRGAGPPCLRRGWLPPLDRTSAGGYGLWISRQCCDELDIRVDFAGCTVRLVTRAPGPGQPPSAGAVPAG